MKNDWKMIENILAVIITWYDLGMYRYYLFVSNIIWVVNYLVRPREGSDLAESTATFLYLPI